MQSISQTANVQSTIQSIDDQIVIAQSVIQPSTRPQPISYAAAVKLHGNPTVVRTSIANPIQASVIVNPVKPVTETPKTRSNTNSAARIPCSQPSIRSNDQSDWQTKRRSDNKSNNQLNTRSSNKSNNRPNVRSGNQSNTRSNNQSNIRSNVQPNPGRSYAQAANNRHNATSIHRGNSYTREELETAFSTTSSSNIDQSNSQSTGSNGISITREQRNIYILPGEPNAFIGIENVQNDVIMLAVANSVDILKKRNIESKCELRLLAKCLECFAEKDILMDKKIIDPYTFLEIFLRHCRNGDTHSYYGIAPDLLIKHVATKILDYCKENPESGTVESFCQQIYLTKSVCRNGVICQIVSILDGIDNDVKIIPNHKEILSHLVCNYFKKELPKAQVIDELTLREFTEAEIKEWTDDYPY